MMSLPKFENENPTEEELRGEAARLHAQADKMLAETGLLALLEQHGHNPSISGSYAYNLMVYPDLDMDLELDTITPEIVAGVAGNLAASGFIRKINYRDTVHFPAIRPGIPTGYWFGLEIPYEGDSWGVDCWLTEVSTSDVTNDYAERLAVLDQPARDAILRIKYDLIRTNQYGMGHYLSVDVYNAVLAGIRDTESFLANQSLSTESAAQSK